MIAALCAGTAAQAATITENSGGVGAFSSDVFNPTVIAAGTTQINGTGDQGVFDLFRIDGLASGAQSLNFVFTAPAGIGFSYAAGGVLRANTAPFNPNAYSGGFDFGYPNVGFFSQTDTATLNLAAGFSGPLYLALNFTYGANLNYTINLPGVPAAVPLPAAGWMLLSVLCGLAWMRRRRLFALHL